MSLIEYSEDLSTAEAPAPLPINTYPATIEAAERKMSKSGMSEYLGLTVRVPAEAYPADYTDGDPDGTLLSYNRVTIENTARGRYRMRKLCEACGVQPKRTVDPADFLGLSVNVLVSHQEYEGVQQAQVDKIVAA